MRTITILLMGLLCSCASRPAITVDVSDRKMKIANTEYKILTGKATGGRPRSERTPLGKLEVISKEPNHRFGPVVRIGGVSKDGYRQDGRGILIHRTNLSRRHTRGCIGVSRAQMLKVYRQIKVGDIIEIRA